jgi:acetylornithine deacetylase
MTSPAAPSTAPDPIRHPAADAAVALTEQLVRLDSTNPSLVAGAAGEGDVIDHLARRLVAGGFEIELVPPLEPAGSGDGGAGATGRPSLVARRRGTGGGRTLILNGHVDTVGTDGMDEPFSARILGDRLTGRLLGRGACDMKGGISGMVAAVEHVWAEQPPAGDVVLALVADEEHASIGTEAVIEHLRRAGARSDGRPDARPGDACIVAEPTWMDVVTAHRGFTVTEVRFTGRAAHTSQPAHGVNALTHLARLVHAVEGHDAELRSRPPHPLAGHGSLQATVAQAGTAPFTLPASATLVVERRTLPGEPSTIGADEVRALLDQLGRDDPALARQLDAEVEVLLHRDAWQADELDDATRVLLDLLDEASAALGRPTPPRAGAPYWMESALWQASGVPALVYGPAGGGMHAIDEWLDLDQLRHFTVAMTRVIRGFCSPTTG